MLVDDVIVFGDCHDPSALTLKLSQAVEALTDAMNYWEPPCHSEDCDKGYHVTQYRAWKKAEDTLRGLGG